MQHLVFRRVCNPHVTTGGNTHTLQPADLSSEGEVGFASDRATSKFITQIAPLKLVTQTLSSVTPVPQPMPSTPFPVNPVTGGDSACPLGENLIVPPPML